MKSQMAASEDIIEIGAAKSALQKSGLFAPSDFAERSQLKADVAFLESELIRLKALHTKIHSLTDFTRGSKFQSAMSEATSCLIGIRERIDQLDGMEFKALFPANYVDTKIPAECKRIVVAAKNISAEINAICKAFSFLMVPLTENQKYYAAIHDFEERLQGLKDDIDELGYSQTTHHLDRIFNPKSYFKLAKQRSGSYGTHAFNTQSYRILKEGVLSYTQYLKDLVPKIELTQADLEQLIGFTAKLEAFEAAVASVDIEKIPEGLQHLVGELVDRIRKLKTQMIVVEDFLVTLSQKEHVVEKDIQTLS